MKEKIRETLEELNEDVYYGAGKFKGRDTWDCIIFGKRRLKSIGTSGKDSNMEWFVAIVKEDEIPEGMEKQVIDKMRDIELKRKDTDAAYAYVEKSGECMVEICTMEFYKTIKGCA